MQTNLKSLLFISTLLFLTSGFVQGAPEIGQIAPNFETRDIDGNQVSISDYKGKIIVLSWFNKDCPFDKKHHAKPYQNMQSLQKWAKGKGIIWISILSSAPGNQGYETADEAKKTVEEQGIQAAHFILDPEGKIGKMYDAKTTPHMFIIKKDGTMGYMGAIDSIKSTKTEDINKADKYFLNALQAILAKKDFDPKQTIPYGCSVKY